jgi:hypothetical protein
VAKDTRPFVALTDEYPDHPKIVGLSDAAFRAHVELICWSNRKRQDGKIPSGMVRRYGDDVMGELEEAGLIDATDSGRELHDYLEHNPSKAEIEERMADKKKRAAVGGKKSAHRRWHVERGEYDPECEFCQAG